MTTQKQLDERISKWLEAEAPAHMPDHAYRTTFERTRKSKQHVGWRAFLGRMQVYRSFAAVAGVAVVVVAVAILGPYFKQLGVAGLPSALPPAPTATPGPSPVLVGPRDGSPLGWSSDGTRVLVQKGVLNLFVLHADGSETQVAEQPAGFADLHGSARPSGATISPDGSRVVYAGLTKVGASCHNGALIAVDADGGPAAVLFKSQLPQNGIIRDPTFSPDGNQIAFVDDYCDSDATVWVMDADGRDAHRIVGPLGVGHVEGLAWSAAGDRIALLLDLASYTFAADGSDFRQGGLVPEFCWPGRPCQPTP
jgi:WD40-like Beta Propeller Repeat